MTSGDYNQSPLERKREELMNKENSDLAPLFKVLERIANTLDDLSDNLVVAISRPVPTASGASDRDSDLPVASCHKDEASGEFLWEVPEEALARPKPCNRCGYESIHWVLSRKGKKVPLESDGHSHISRCGEDRSKFSGGGEEDVPF